MDSNFGDSTVKGRGDFALIEASAYDLSLSGRPIRSGSCGLYILTAASVALVKKQRTLKYHHHFAMLCLS